MYLIVGLGNPENKYANTRHNMGFDTINEFANRNDIKITKTKFNALYEKTKFQNEDVILLKPQTYMNLSGESIKEAVDFYKIELNKIVVIYDDMDIEKGIIKVRKKGRHRFTQWDEISCGRAWYRRIRENKNWNWKAKR